MSYETAVDEVGDGVYRLSTWIEPAGLVLSPAYDLCPQGRLGESAAQAMAFTRDGGRDARLSLLTAASHEYHLDAKEAQAIIDAQVAVIRDEWDDACDQAELTAAQRAAFLGRQFLNPYAFS